jgi:dimethylhistidine N-methyltransferase
VGSRLFERITALPEYYLTRTERGILAMHAGSIVVQARQGKRLRIAELGAGSAAKTRLLLDAAVRQQESTLYEPIDVSASALQEARQQIERQIAGVTVVPCVMDYTNGLAFTPACNGEHRLVLYIGSSIGNFESHEAASLLRRVRARLNPGDSFLLGVDLVKSPETLLAAYDDAAGVTAAFNRNVLTRINRELGANFDPESFAHRAIWNRAESRIEMHLVSRTAQYARLAALDLTVHFDAGETIHTENSYKYAPGQAEALLALAGFDQAVTWTDKNKWFAVCLGHAN